MRRAGRSRREIKELVGFTSNAQLNDALKGEPPPAWTLRPRAKDELRARARELREQGLDYDRIAAKLGVAKSSVSLWVRDLPRPERLSYEECRKRGAEGVRRYWAKERPIREAQREAVRAAAAAEIDALTDREILIAGAIAYWCEGAKNKPYLRQDRVIFTNSDPMLITFFMRFLEVRDQPGPPHLSRPYPRERRRRGSPEVLATRDRRQVRPIPSGESKAAQSGDRPQEHRRQLPRLPSSGRAGQCRPVQEDRRLVRSDHEQHNHLT